MTITENQAESLIWEHIGDFLWEFSDDNTFRKLSNKIYDAFEHINVSMCDSRYSIKNIEYSVGTGTKKNIVEFSNFYTGDKSSPASAQLEF